ncbi:hypothetical protein ACVMB0_000059 [Bradyrhizobium sp. USDA 4451]
MQNGFVESFNGRMRDELLNETLFFGLDDARAKLAAWVADYNGERPHSSQQYLTPAACLRRHSHRNGRSAAQPRPAPPIVRCSTRATWRTNHRDSNCRWMKVQWQVAWRMDAIIAMSAPRPTRIVTPSASISMPRHRMASPGIRLGLASRCLALMASNRDWCHGVYHRRYKRQIASHRRRQPACSAAPGEHLLWAQPVSPGDLGNDRAWYQRLLDDPGPVVLGEPTTASRLRDHFQSARRHVRLKRMVKHRHKPIPSKRS